MNILLPVLAAVLHGTAYVMYLNQVYSGASVPNPASWSVWAFLSSLNALAFVKASGSWLKGLQFITGSVMCLIVFGYSVLAGRFAPLTNLGYVVLFLSVITCIVWKKTRAAYASVGAAAILLISSVPTVVGVWQNPGLEHRLPWLLWTAAFCLTFANVIRGWEEIHRSEPWPWMITVVPISGIVMHGVVAFLAQ